MTMPNVPPSVAAAAAAAQIELPEPDYDYPIVTLVVSDPIFPMEAKPQPPPPPPQQQQVKCPHCQGAILIPAPVPASEVEFDSEDPKPLYWGLGRPHPFAPSLKIVRMHRLREIVYIFSVTSDGQACIIDELSFEKSVRLVQKSMAGEVFAGELSEADEAAPIVCAYDPDADDDEPEPEPAKTEPNGAQSASVPS